MGNEPFPELQTQRLVLRKTRRTDAPELLRVFSDPEVMRFYNLDVLTDIQQAEAIVDGRDSRFMEGYGIRWAICLKDDDRFIGSAGLQPWHHAWRFAELGYDLGREYWGKGIMVEALSAILDHGFGPMNLHRVEAQVMPANRQSSRVLEKLGFTREGLLRERGYWKGAHHDLIIYSLLAREHYFKDKG
jgi:[ribosomal protein S5]-alanine N-acetyltransferase